MTKFTIDVVSDTVCPWCYVGKTNLEKGIAQYRAAAGADGDTFAVAWHPYYLQPDAPREGVDKEAYFAARFGAARAAAMHERLRGIGAAAGIAFRFGGRTGNTRDSHRLIQLARQHGGERVQDKVVAALMRGYFEEEKDVTSHAFLADAGVAAGLPREQVEGWLKSDAGGDVVDKEVAEAQQNLVSGVPNFTVNGEFELRGAQPPEGFKAVFDKIKAAEG